MPVLHRSYSHTVDWLPLAHLNLQINPFGERTTEDRVAAATIDFEDWTDWLAADHRALQFLGACGRGKSTHLLALCRQLPGWQYFYLPPHTPCPAIPQGRPLVIDEAQRLPLLRRWRLLRQKLPLVLGTHRDLSRPLTRAGYAVRTVDLHAIASPERLAEILNRRIEAVRLGPGSVPRIMTDDAAVLLVRFGSNIRAAEHYLYQQVQKHAGADRGEVRLVD